MIFKPCAMIKKDFIFYFSVIFISVCLLFSTSVVYFFILYILFFFINLYYFQDIRKALYISAVFSIPTYYGKSFFPSDESKFVFIRPFSAFVILLSFLSIKKIQIRIRFLPNIFITFFFFWAFLSFIFISPDFEKLGGLYHLAIALLFYLETQVYIHDDKNIKVVIFLIYIFIIIQSMFAFIQYILGHPLYLNIEEGIKIFPYGRFAIEDSQLFRPSGTFAQPTDLARFLTILLPVVLLDSFSIFSRTRLLRNLVIILSTFAIFVSLTRFSWLITLFIYIFVVGHNWRLIKINWFSYILKNKILLTVIIIFIFVFMPFFTRRLASTNLSFQEGGSFDYRITLAKEALNLIIMNPVFGVGLRNFVSEAQLQNVSGIYTNYATEVHNVPLLIASEMGIPALLSYLAFCIFSIIIYKNRRKSVHNRNRKLFYDAALIGAFVYLTESMMGTLFWGNHIVLFFLYMGIII
jgi:teichuronic acid biosynthesis protein TuaE